MGKYATIGPSCTQFKSPLLKEIKHYDVGDYIGLCNGLYICFDGWFLVRSYQILEWGDGTDIKNKHGDKIRVKYDLTPKETQVILDVPEWPTISIENRHLDYFMRLNYNIIIEEVYYEGEFMEFVAYIDELESYSCYGKGKTIEEAIKSLEGAKETLFEIHCEKGAPIPMPRNLRFGGRECLLILE